MLMQGGLVFWGGGALVEHSTLIPDVEPQLSQSGSRGTCSPFTLQIHASLFFLTAVLAHVLKKK